ncbi:MAG TPA: 3'(2'),5'-bisphosphate nucleotidase CysQ [Sphingomonadales bacterium]|nr:3'(2'),5'-bisphosphate nucleotidase CysQ [Sphingomonadales bacterium]
MIPADELPALARSLLPSVRKAGRAIMNVYVKANIKMRQKRDASPVTEADERAEAILMLALKTKAPGIPILAEEYAERHGVPKRAEREYFLIDPLDGTKEFVGKDKAFTVNVALVQKAVPVMGIVYAPAKRLLYFAYGPGRVFRVEGSSKPKAISVRKADPKKLVIVASRSHRNPETEAFLKTYPKAKHVSIGSSLKFCLVAEGKADLYPRLGPTMEWDTAAGHAVLTAAGGEVLNPDGSAFRYGKAGHRNGHFLARGDAALPLIPFR